MFSVWQAAIVARQAAIGQEPPFAAFEPNDKSLKSMDKLELRALGLTEEMARHLETDDIDRPFGYRCRPPFYARSSQLARSEIVALWECGTVVCYFNRSNACFEQCSLENTEEVFCRYSTVQGLLAELFIDEFEDETDISMLAMYARLFDFRSFGRLLQEVGEPKTDYTSWRRSFAASC